MHPAYVLLLALFLAAVIARTAITLTTAKRLAPNAKRMNSALVVVLMAVAWIAWFCLCTLDPWRAVVGDTVRGVGLALLGLGFLLAIDDFLRFQSNGRYGLLSFVRHPIYYGFSLWILGWGIYHAARFSLLAGLFAIGNILYWRYAEEKALEAQFGDDYRRYRAGTWL